MRMTDVISALGLTIFPIVALVLFLAAFVAVLLQVTSKARRSEFDRAASLPLADDASTTKRDRS